LNAWCANKKFWKKMPHNAFLMLQGRWKIIHLQKEKVLSAYLRLKCALLRLLLPHPTECGRLLN